MEEFQKSAQRRWDFSRHGDSKRFNLAGKREGVQIREKWCVSTQGKPGEENEHGCVHERRIT